jgi:hypothetical protein
MGKISSGEWLSYSNMGPFFTPWIFSKVIKLKQFMSGNILENLKGDSLCTYCGRVQLWKPSWKWPRERDAKRSHTMWLALTMRKGPDLYRDNWVSVKLTKNNWKVRKARMAFGLIIGVPSWILSSKVLSCQSYHHPRTRENGRSPELPVCGDRILLSTCWDLGIGPGIWSRSKSSKRWGCQPALVSRLWPST